MSKTFDLDPLYTKQHLRTIIFKSYLLYVEKFYPHIDIADVCMEAGLPISYIENEDNWVSVTFESQFMEALQKRVQSADLMKEVGEFGVQAEVVGKSLHFFCFNLFPLAKLYEKLPFVTSLVNKMFSLEIISKETNSISYKIVPNYKGLNRYEKNTLAKRMPEYIKNTVGYYSALPTQKNLEKAQIDVNEIYGETVLTVKYPREKSKGAFWLPLAGVSGLLFGYVLNQLFNFSGNEAILGYAMPTLFLMSYVFSKALLLKRDNVLNLAAEETSNALGKIDSQFENLDKAQTLLRRQLEESSALTEVVKAIATMETEAEVLSQTCESLVNNLRYDRAVILLADKDKNNSLRYSADYGIDPELQNLFEKIELETDIPSNDPNKIANVFRNKISILIKDVEEHLGSLIDEASRVLLARSKSKSFAAVPIFTNNETYGVLIVDCVEQLKTLTDNDIKILETVGSQLGVALSKIYSKNSLQIALAETQALSSSYSRFVPFEVLQQMGYKNVFDVHIGDGIERRCTILFNDIRNFSTLCETMHPNEVLRFLNGYFGRLSPIIKEHHGIIDKFIGDCIMATFLSPANAAMAAIEIQRKLVDYNIQRRRSGRNSINSGIGIASGDVIVDPLGFDNRLEITVVSDVVNIASRLDGLCKDLDAKILSSGIPDKTLKKLSNKGVKVADRGLHLVKGRKEKVPVMELVDEAIPQLFDQNEQNPDVLTYKTETTDFLFKKLTTEKAS